ncbi:SDR family NAD(P)-dependent oxidoreductase [Novosphingobium sp. Fuku2-ISO-50]|uniref:SDR family NAD(P)-dependent oxidoreductase n=1 Tax=Novosphingobium sp. Fuku2-ISO-50 TaxID=1739114 RepID=UPI00076DED82|nr:glucose 1-dehydrogenase [Novosphingobium sp. Fuku2-ISO-50]KUR73266.1 3-alpha-hydroxysteroid dehydrogenase [Novosphingobium sp. Fuku2-ISO-50]
MGRLSGKVAIITGAAQGMGEAHCKAFVKEGAKVILTDINAEGGQKLADSLGENALFIHHDVAKEADWIKVLAEGEARFGTVNVLVNNAGVLGKIAPTTEFSEADYRWVTDINQIGVFLGMKTVLPSLIKSGGGSIVNISSVAGIVAIYGAPNLAYVGTKFAVRGMTKQIAVEYGDKNVRCNSIHPGYIRTPMMAAATDEDGGDALSMIPLRRLADPSEVSNLAVFLASDESAFISGTEHVIDGGMTAL